MALTPELWVSLEVQQHSWPPAAGRELGTVNKLIVANLRSDVVDLFAVAEVDVLGLGGIGMYTVGRVVSERSLFVRSAVRIVHAIENDLRRRVVRHEAVQHSRGAQVCYLFKLSELLIFTEVIPQRTIHFRSLF